MPRAVLHERALLFWTGGVELVAKRKFMIKKRRQRFRGTKASESLRGATLKRARCSGANKEENRTGLNEE
jgi:hypothetical protein